MADGHQRGERLQIMLLGDELSALDDFRFKKRMPSRAAAVRELLKRGLAAEGFNRLPLAPSRKTTASWAVPPRGAKAGNRAPAEFASGRSHSF